MPLRRKAAAASPNQSVLDVDPKAVAKELQEILRSEPLKDDASRQRLRSKLRELRAQKLALATELEAAANTFPLESDLGMSGMQLVGVVGILRKDGMEEDDGLSPPPGYVLPADLPRIHLPTASPLDATARGRLQQEVRATAGAAVRLVGLTQGIFLALVQAEERDLGV